MLKYHVYKKQQQDKFNKLPMKAAFGDEQFKEMMAEWGLTTSEEDLAKITSLGYGAYCLNEDAHLFTEFTAQSLKEDEEYYKDDEQLEDAFIYEFGNHECGYTGNPYEALGALGMTKKEIDEDDRLKRIFLKSWHNYIFNVLDY